MRIVPVIALVLLVALTAAGCGDVDNIVNALDNATAQLTGESRAWQKTLDELEKKLADDASALAKDTLRQVQDVAARAVATAGVEVRCDADFIGRRIRLHLDNIRRALRGGPSVALNPAICQMVPEHIDLRLDADKISVLSLYGYDMPVPDANTLKVFIRDVDQKDVDVTSRALNIQHHYLATINLSGTGIYSDLHSTSRALIIKDGAIELSSIPVVDSAHDLDIQTFVGSSASSTRPVAEAVVPKDLVLIGGGCRSEWVGYGHLLTASYPVGNKWICKSKDHGSSEAASITAFALAAHPIELDDVRIDSTTGLRASHPSAVVTVPDDRVVLSGGCSTSWADPRPGSLIVDSFPTSQAWHCEAKDHEAPSPEMVTAYVISAKRSSRLKQFVTYTDSSVAAHPAAVAAAPPHSAQLVGGGCDISYSGPGNLLTASFPQPNGAGWECRAKDHGRPDPARLRAFAIWISKLPR